MNFLTQDEDPLFSVLIPTFNRAEYLIFTLKSCVTQDFQSVEFVVVDDCSGDNTQDIVEDYARYDSRVKYVRRPENVGMLENFEMGLGELSGEYILVLGGDDALMPEGLQALADVIQDTSAKLITWRPSSFYYPGARDDRGSLILLQSKEGSGFSWISSQSFLEKQAVNLSYVSDEDCPMIYVKSVAHKSLIDSIKQRSGGRFYSCSTPDGYSGLVLACEVDQFLKIGSPVTMYGGSPNSAGWNYISGKKAQEDLSKKFFKDSAPRPMHRELGSIPYSPLISLMTADFLLTATKLPNSRYLTPKICSKNLLTTALAELQDGLMDDDKREREITILYELAKYLNEESFFRSLCRSKRINRRTVLSGNAFSRSVIYFDATDHDLKNIYSASHFAKFALVMKKNWSLRSIGEAAINSLRYFLQGKTWTRRLAEYLPSK